MCAIVLICINVTSCTSVPLSETLDQSTGDEDNEVLEEPDN